MINRHHAIECRLENSVFAALAFNQRFFHTFASGNILKRSFIIFSRAIFIANNTAVLREPNFFSVFAVSLKLVTQQYPALLQQTTRFCSILRIDVELICNIGNVLDHCRRRFISQNSGEGGIDCDEAAFKRRLKNTFDGVLDNGSIVLLSLFHLPVEWSTLECCSRGAREDGKRFHLSQREGPQAINHV